MLCHKRAHHAVHLPISALASTWLAAKKQGPAEHYGPTQLKQELCTITSFQKKPDLGYVKKQNI